jgi:hypothetical protein
MGVKDGMDSKDLAEPHEQTGRSARKHRAILKAAEEMFQHG